MSADKLVLTANSVHALAQELAARNKWPTAFWIGLMCAAAVHAAIVVGLSRPSPRYLGDPGGSADAINVELVDEAELRSLSSDRSPAENSAPAPAAPAPPPQPEQARAPEPTPPQPDKAQPSPPTPPQPAAPQPSEAAAAQKPSSVQPIEKDKPEAAAPQDQQQKKSEADQAAKTELKPPAQLDLSVPFDMTMQGAPNAPAGRSSSVSRPPGVTRSGENDAFGRGVISALRKTMPPPNGTKGRVTIRLFLNERGNIVEVRLVQGSGIRDIDDSVMFAAQQTSFPFPPKGATVADRTFLVTYVYK